MYFMHYLANHLSRLVLKIENKYIINTYYFTVPL